MKELLINFDKSCNRYKRNKETCKKFLVENITKTYTTAVKRHINAINKSKTKTAEKLNIVDRMERIEKLEAYITIKDHKENFLQNPTFRLIYPSKYEIGKISKHTFDNINKKVSENIQTNQSKNSTSIIGWFKGITN